MTELEPTPDRYPPPTGEEIHLPGPSLLPLATAVCVTAAVVGLTIWIGWVIIGAIGALICIALWIRDTRRDIAALPPEH